MDKKKKLLKNQKQRENRKRKQLKTIITIIISLSIIVGGFIYLANSEGVKANLETRKMDKKQLELKNNKKLVKYLNNELKNNVIEIDRGKEQTLYLFSDPLCPFCQKEMNDPKFLNIAKNFNLKVVLVPLPMHKQKAVDISELIYKKVNLVEDSEKKFEILKKYINSNYIYDKSEMMELSKEQKYSKVFQNGKIKVQISKKIKNVIEIVLENNLISGTPYKFVK